MKLKDLVSIAKNKKNKQVNFSLKKTKLKQCDMDLEDILELKVTSRRLK
jgi:hypothetical protein